MDFNTITAYNDTVYAYVTNKGLVRYLYDGNNTLTEDITISLPFGTPQHLAADEFGLYISYIRYDLYAYDKVTLLPTGFYEHGLETIYTHVWGPQNLFCENGLIFLAEFHGQTTILTNNNGYLTAINQPNKLEQNEVFVYPNPVQQAATISFKNPKRKTVMFRVFDAHGKMVDERNNLRGNVVVFDRKNLSSGLYTFTISSTNELLFNGKIILE